MAEQASGQALQARRGSVVAETEIEEGVSQAATAFRTAASGSGAGAMDLAALLAPSIEEPPPIHETAAGEAKDVAMVDGTEDTAIAVPASFIFATLLFHLRDPPLYPLRTDQHISTFFFGRQRG